MNTKTILKIIVGGIAFFILTSSFKSLSKVKKEISSNDCQEEVIYYIHSCELRIIILLLFIIIQNISLID